MTRVTWVLESDVFPESHGTLRDAVRAHGHRLVDWNDAWWSDGFPRNLEGSPVFFHGSLGNAAEIAEKLPWSPGSFCNTSTFRCSAWYDAARNWLLHTDWRFMPANDFVRSAAAVAAELGNADRLFVRPDSPLKPFSGRVVNTASVTLESLDHGFYFDDPMLPIVVAPVRIVTREWRFVVVRSAIVAGSEYDASTRSAATDSPDSDAWSFAESVAAAIPSPSDVFVLDICESNHEMRLLELNPFGGADLYACDASAVVEAVTDVASDT